MATKKKAKKTAAQKKKSKASKPRAKSTKKAAKKSVKKSTSKKRAAAKKKSATKKKTAKSAKKSAAKSAKKTAKSAKSKKAAPKKSANSKPRGKSGGSDPFASLLPPVRKSHSNSKRNWSEIFSPTDNRVLVVPDPAQEMTQGGLYIPQSSQDKPQQGVVASLGPGHIDDKGRRRPLDVRLGDRVMYRSYAGQRFQLLNEDLLILKEDEILGVVPD